jgi:outer membrane protein assembly factor BamB
MHQQLLVAIIPTLGIGGPLAVLALLFPGLFGGAFLLFRRWLVLLTVTGFNSSLYLLHFCFRVALRDSWLGRPGVLWTAMALITLLGLLWSWRRHAEGIGFGPEGQARWGEFIGLLSLSLLGVGGVCLCVGTPGSHDLSTNLLIVFAVGVWSGMGSMTWQRLRHRIAMVPTEGVILGAMVATFLCIAPLETTAEATADSAARLNCPVVKCWEFSPRTPGMVLGPPLVQGEFVYVTAAHPLLGIGTAYCLKRAKGNPVWKFDNGGRMKAGFSAPCFAEGRIYFGEGWHRDQGCKLYCLDAATGTMLWEFATSSHTESSPCVVDGKVYFGAGDSGLFCVDAKTGLKLWQYSDGLHIDANPVVSQQRVYCGSGVDRDKAGTGETAVFCLDANSGEPLWKVKTTLPAWGGVTVAGKHAFFALGNGDYFSDNGDPAGAVLCVEAISGAEVWCYRVGNGVLSPPVADEGHIFFACRNGYCYCVDREKGKLIRKWDVGSPAVASPALVPHSCCGKTSHVIVIGAAGKVCCLDPENDGVVWEWDELGKGEATVTSSPRVLVRHTPAGDRLTIYFGAEVGRRFSGFAKVYSLETVP